MTISEIESKIKSEPYNPAHHIAQEEAEYSWKGVLFQEDEDYLLA